MRRHKWGAYWMAAAIYEGVRFGAALTNKNVLGMVIAGVLAFLFATFAYDRMTKPGKP